MFFFSCAFFVFYFCGFSVHVQVITAKVVHCHFFLGNEKQILVSRLKKKKKTTVAQIDTCKHTRGGCLCVCMCACVFV